MGIVDITDLVAISQGDEIVCFECVVNSDEFSTFKENQVIAKSEIESDATKVYFCDLCKERL